MAIPNSLDQLMLQSYVESKTTLNAPAVRISSEGDAASGAVDSGAPVKIGAFAVNPTSLPSDVDANDRVNLIADLKGRLINYLGVCLDSTNDSIRAMSSATSAQVGTDMVFYSALSTAVQSVKASAGNLYGYEIDNSNAGTAFVQVFNVAAGSVTLGTTTPNYVIPFRNASSRATQFETPASFSTAISVAATTTATGSTALGTGLVATFFFK